MNTNPARLIQRETPGSQYRIRMTVEGRLLNCPAGWDLEKAKRQRDLLAAYYQATGQRRRSTPDRSSRSD